MTYTIEKEIERELSKKRREKRKIKKGEGMGENETASAGKESSNLHFCFSLHHDEFFTS